MPRGIFSDAELDRLAHFPEEISADDLIRAFTLTGPDRALIGRRRRPANRLGLALQLCALRYLGFVPSDLNSAPAEAVRFVADQLSVDVTELGNYGRREQTRTDHTWIHCHDMTVHDGFDRAIMDAMVEAVPMVMQ